MDFMKISERAKNGQERMKSKNEALTYMASLPAESELSTTNLSTSVTLRVNHSSLPKIAPQKNLKNPSGPNY